MSDRDVTPRLRLRQSAEDRDLAARRRAAPVHGVPLVPRAPEEPSGEVTEPHELLDRDLSEAQIEIVRRSRRNSDDPVFYGDLVKVVDRLTRERSENQQRNKLYEDILRSPLELGRKFRRWAIAAAVIAGLGGGGGGAAILRHTEPAAAAPAANVDSVRVEQLQRDIQRLDVELRELRAVLGRRSQLEPAGDSRHERTP